MGNQNSRLFIYHKDDRIVCCVDGVCEEFECKYGMSYDGTKLECGDKVLMSFETKRNNDMPLAKP